MATCIIEEGGGGSSAATKPCLDILKAALDAKEGKLDQNIQFVPGSTGRSVKIPKKSQRTD